MKKIRLIQPLMCFGLALIMGCACGAAGSLRPVALGGFTQGEDLSVDDIMELNGWKPDLIWYGRETGVPWRIGGQFTTMKIKNARDAVKSLSCVRGVMRIGDLSFACVKTESDGDVRTFHLQQLYKGLMVYDGYFEVSAKKSGEPYELRGIYIPDLDIDVKPALTADEAKKHVSSPEGRSVAEPLLMIYAQTDDANSAIHLCWRFKINISRSLPEKYVFINAHTGETIGELRLIDD
jgi:Zn-dependent metalloprotease